MFLQIVLALVVVFYVIPFILNILFGIYETKEFVKDLDREDIDW